MSLSLEKNQTISLEKAAGTSLHSVILGLGWDPVKPKGLFQRLLTQNEIDLDASAIVLDENFDSIDTVWFRQLQSNDRSIRHSGDNLTGEGEGDDETIQVDLGRLPANVHHIVFTINSYRGQTFDSVANAYVRILNAANDTEIARFNLAEKGSHTGVVIGILSRDSQGWNFRSTGIPASGRTVQDIVPRAIEAAQNV